MKVTRFALKAALAFGIATAALASPVLMPPAAAQEKVSAPVAKILVEAQKAAEAKQFKQCLAKAKEADALASKTANDQYVINQMLGFCASNAGEYGTAARAYEGMLNSGRLPAADRPKIMKAVIVYSYQAGQYAKTIQYGKKYTQEIERNNDILLLIAQSYFLQKDYQNALTWIQDLVNGQEKAGQRPAEDSLRLMMTCANNLNDRPGTLAALEKLVSYYGQTKDWKSLLGMLAARPGLDNRAILDVYRLQLEVGVLSAEDYLGAAQSALQLGLPGEAVAILDKGVASGVIGSSDRHKRLINLAKTEAATDKGTLASQETEAKKSAKGEALVRVGEAQLGYGNAAKAMELISAGIAKGGVTNEANAKVQLGRAQFAGGKSADARKTFESIKGEGNYPTIARYWTFWVKQKS